MDIDNTLKNVISSISETAENGISFDMKLEIIKNLVSEKTVNILKKQIILSKTINEKANFNLPSKEIENESNIRKFLKLFGAKNIKISGGGQDYSTDYTGGRDYYDVPVTISFDMEK